MTIETKHNIRETVVFFYNNTVVAYPVEAIRIKVLNGDSFDMKITIVITYKFKVFNFSDYDIIELDEQFVFKTKKELIESL